MIWDNGFCCPHPAISLPPLQTPRFPPLHPKPRKHNLGKGRQVVWSICKMFGGGGKPTKNTNKKHNKTNTKKPKPKPNKNKPTKQKENSYQLPFWFIKPMKLKQYLTMPSIYQDVPSYFNRHTLHSISHTITRFNQFHRNVTSQRSSYSIPIQKHHSNFWVISPCKIKILKERQRACIKNSLGKSSSVSL